MKLAFACSAILIIQFFACSTQSVAPTTKLEEGIELGGIFHAGKNSENEKRYVEDNGNELFLSSFGNKSDLETRAIVENKVKIFDSFLHPNADPYFGVRELGPTCSVKELPSSIKRFGEGFISESIFLFATQGHVFGACNSSADVLKSQIQWLYCSRQKALFQIKYFFPSASPWKTQAIARCLP